MDAPRQHVDRLAWATLLLLVAVLTCQPAAHVLLGLLAVALVGAVAEFARALQLARYFAVAAVAAGIAFLGYKLGIRLIGEDAIGASRCPHGRRRRQGRVVLALGSLRVAEPLRRDVVGLAGSSRGHRARREHRALALRRASRPMLLSRSGSSCSAYRPADTRGRDHQFEVYRTLVSLSALIALYFGLGALALWVMFREWLEGRVSGRALLVSERVATARHRVRRDGRRPCEQERGHAHRRGRG